MTDPSNDDRHTSTLDTRGGPVPLGDCIADLAKKIGVPIPPAFNSYSDDDEPMVEVETPPVKTPKRPKGTGRPRWSRYRVKSPVKCDDCMLVLTLAKGRAPAARFALFKRVQDGKDLLLCPAHAQERRDEDGMNRELRGRLGRDD